VTDRFPRAVAATLIDAGWDPRRRDEERARDWGQRLAAHLSPAGNRHAFFPAALAVLAEFGGLRVELDGPGEDLALTGFALDPLLALHTVDTLAAFGARIGARLAPLGVEDGGVAALAVDERGGVFALDHGGEWFLGESVDAALTTLILGRSPARVREDGTSSVTRVKPVTSGS
jgi:hypothetical protein